ncbi:MAG: Deoxyribodipyrimidine photo-lyase [bacterium]|nr:Deoxyribodipyrimidine photo-lyase [bacterium]
MISRYRRGVVWYRLDLRTADHPALTAASRDCDLVLPVFLMHEHRMRHPLTAPLRAGFLLESIAALQRNLERLDGGLCFRLIPTDDMLMSDPLAQYQDAVCTFLREVQADALYLTPQVEPGFVRQDSAIRDWCTRHGVAVHAIESTTTLPLASLAQQSGEPYRVYTPFWRNLWGRWQADPPAILPPPRLPAGSADWIASVPADPLPTLHSLGRNPGDAATNLTGGEGAARRQLTAFLEGPVADYADGRDFLGRDVTSRLGAALQSGCLSSREVIAQSAARMWQPGSPAASLEKFIKEVAWRDFAHAILWHFPETVRDAFQERYRTLTWRDDPIAFTAWSEGQTGYPVIDAAMRELGATGTMHNRARMLTASFLTKDLGLHWRLGADWFLAHLIDGSLANNTLGWQWTAGIGTDAAPYFRIFNPVTQAQKFDPHGVYLRRWLPELAHLPDAVIHDPLRHPAGLSYPAPIIDRAAQRQLILARYQQSR